MSEGMSRLTTVCTPLKSMPRVTPYSQSLSVTLRFPRAPPALPAAPALPSPGLGASVWSVAIKMS